MRPPFIGVLSLDTAFERIRGDIGNPESYQVPCVIEVIQGADSTKIVHNGLPEASLLENFVKAAQKLEREGAVALTSTCGFLITSQKIIASSVSIPTILSSLSLLPLVQSACPGKTGIITASSMALGDDAFQVAGVRRDNVVVKGLENDATFTENFLTHKANQRLHLDRRAIEQTVIQAAKELQDNNADLSAILLECGNLPPYASAIKAATSLPVFHMLDLAHMLYHAQNISK